jgi:hypothetical protein
MGQIVCRAGAVAHGVTFRFNFFKKKIFDFLLSARPVLKHGPGVHGTHFVLARFLH